MGTVGEREQVWETINQYNDRARELQGRLMALGTLFSFQVTVLATPGYPLTEKAWSDMLAEMNHFTVCSDIMINDKRLRCRMWLATEMVEDAAFDVGAMIVTNSWRALEQAVRMPASVAGNDRAQPLLTILLDSNTL